MTDLNRTPHADRFDVVVVGAGVSGLTVAHALRRAGYRVLVLEATHRAGGVISTRERDGFRYETATNSALDSGPELRQLIAELGIAGERVDVKALAAKRFVVRDGRLQPLPTSPPALLTNRTFSMSAKLRLLREPFIPAAPEHSEESVAAFARRRLGDEWLDYAIDPFVSGVHAGDPETLSLRAAFPRLHALEQTHGSILRGQVHRARQQTGGAPRSFSFKHGMQTLTDALARSVEGVVTNARVEIAPDSGGGYELRVSQAGSTRSIRARSAVIAAPADAAAHLVASFAPQAAAQLATLIYAPMSIVVSAYRREAIAHPLDGFGFLVPFRERRPILGALFSSSMFDGRAPADHVLLTTFVGGQRAPERAALDDDALREVVGGELTRLLGARDALWREIVRWSRAIPQYTLGHAARIDAIDRATGAFPTLFFSANWRGGVSLADCVARSFATAAAVQRAIGAPEAATHT